MTPANLRAIRLRIGMSFEEAASLLGYDPKTYGPRERAKSINVFERDMTMLREVETFFNSFLDALESRPWDVLVGFMNDADFEKYEPDLHARLRFNSVHRMALAVAQSFFGSEGLEVPIVEIVPDLYAKWLEHEGKADDRIHREAWATDRLQAFRTIPAPK